MKHYFNLEVFVGFIIVLIIFVLISGIMTSAINTSGIQDPAFLSFASLVPIMMLTACIIGIIAYVLYSTSGRSKGAIR